VSATRSLKPSTAILWSFMALDLIPAFFIYVFGYQENLYAYFDPGVYATAAKLYLSTSFAFIAAVLVGSRLFSRIPQFVALKPSTQGVDDQLASRFGIVGMLLTAIYFVLGGYKKLTLLGTNIDAWTFRTIGYNDTNRILTAGLEVSRRILLPMSLVILLSRPKAERSKQDRNRIRLIAAAQLLGSVMTLDRFPIMLLMFAFMYFKVIGMRSRLAAARALVGRMGGLLLAAGATTFIQYNQTSFKFTDVVFVGWRFLVHRLLTVPSVAAIELSFVNFPKGTTPLYLSYSRLGALIGRRYVGIQQESSLYVTPCGAVGDAWRNFGWPGVFFLGLALGAFGAWLDTIFAEADVRARPIVVFSAVSICFYLIFGVAFSQGVVAQVVFTMFALGAVCMRKAQASGGPLGSAFTHVVKP
jgi:hypothetical protein